MTADGTVTAEEDLASRNVLARHPTIASIANNASEQRRIKGLEARLGRATLLANATAALPLVHRAAAYRAVCEVALCDGPANEPEAAFLDDVRRRLHLDDAAAEALAQEARVAVGLGRA